MFNLFKVCLEEEAQLPLNSGIWSTFITWYQAPILWFIMKKPQTIRWATTQEISSQAWLLFKDHSLEIEIPRSSGTKFEGESTLFSRQASLALSIRRVVNYNLCWCMNNHDRSTISRPHLRVPILGFAIPDHFYGPVNTGLVKLIPGFSVLVILDKKYVYFANIGVFLSLSCKIFTSIIYL